MTVIVFHGASLPTDPTQTLCAEVERRLALRIDAAPALHRAMAGGPDAMHDAGVTSSMTRTTSLPDEPDTALLVVDKSPHAVVASGARGAWPQRPGSRLQSRAVSGSHHADTVYC